MTQTQQPRSGSYDGWIGRNAYDSTGDKIGEITDIFYDDKTRRPEWVSIKTGMFGSKSTFVPIQGAKLREDGKDADDSGLMVNYDKAMVKDAPKIDTDGHMSAQEERELWSYYGYDYQADTTARNTDYGYGEGYLKGDRPDKDFAHRRWNQTTNDWTDERRLEEHTEEVPVQSTATVQVPIEANVRLRRYQTQNQKTETRTVQVPVTETEEHTEVVGVDAQAQTGRATASAGGTTRNQPRS